MLIKSAGTLILAAAMAILLGTVPAQAFQSEGLQSTTMLESLEVVPVFTETRSAAAVISASGRTISCEAHVFALISSTRISGTMILEVQNGSSWDRVTSWSLSGTGQVLETRTHTGVSGNTYRTRIVVTVGSEAVGRMSSSVTIRS